MLHNAPTDRHFYSTLFLVFARCFMAGSWLLLPDVPYLVVMPFPYPTIAPI